MAVGVRGCLHPGFLVGWSREPPSPKIKRSRCVGEAGEVLSGVGKGCKGVSKSLGGLGSGCPGG